MPLFKPFGTTTTEGDRPDRGVVSDTSEMAPVDSMVSIPVVDAIRPVSSPQGPSEMPVGLPNQLQVEVSKPEITGEIPASDQTEVGGGLPDISSNIQKTDSVPDGVVAGNDEPVVSVETVAATQPVDYKKENPVIMVMKGAESGYGTNNDDLLGMARKLTESTVELQQRN